MPVRGSAAAFRDHFPVLAGTVHLASCSIAPRSKALDRAAERMLALLAEDPSPWDQWLTTVERCRERFAGLVKAPGAHVAVVPSATVAAFQVASTFDWSTRPGIVTSAAEYSSLAQVWLGQRARGAEVTSIPADGAETAERYVEAITPRTALVSIPLLSYRNGARMPLKAAVARAHAVGARVFVDAYQGVGVMPVDVGGLDCDYLVSGAMKYLLGMPGIAFLYARPGLDDARHPDLTGWYGRSDPVAFDPTALDFPQDARRFQVNLPPLPSALAADEGLALIEELEPAAVHAHVDELCVRAIDLLRDAGVRLASPLDPDRRGPQVGLLVDEPAELARWLNARRIFPARGHIVRLSPHYCNTAADVDRACAAVARYHRSAASKGRARPSRRRSPCGPSNTP